MLRAWIAIGLAGVLGGCSFDWSAGEWPPCREGACPAGSGCVCLDGKVCVPESERGRPADCAWCEAGWADCTTDPGCETLLGTNTDCTGCGDDCTTPPVDTCLEGAVVHYLDTGTCQQGVCEYDYNSETCGAGETCEVDHCACAGGPRCAPWQECCSSGCADTSSDDAHCGSCLAAACDAGLFCLAGSCVGVGGAWVGAGENGLAEKVRAFDLLALGSTLVLATLVGNNGTGYFLQIRLLPVLGGAWQPATSLSISSNSVAHALALAWEQQDFVLVLLAYLPSGQTGGLPSLHLWRHQLSTGDWTEVTDPTGFPLPCSMIQYLDLARGGDSGRMHALALGAGGCGTSVLYAWFEAGAWNVHPTPWHCGLQPASCAGVVADTASGIPGLAAMGALGLVAMAALETSDLTMVHGVWDWDEPSATWMVHGGPIQQTDVDDVGGDTAIDLGRDGRVWVAWSRMGENQRADLYASLRVSGGWDPVGAGDGLVRAANVTWHGVTTVGEKPWIASVGEDLPAEWSLRVHQYREAAGTWQQVGSALSESPANGAEAAPPVVVSVDGLPVVGFLEPGDSTGFSLQVLRYSP